MSINTYILSSSEKLRPFKTELKSIAKAVELSIKKLVPIGNIDVVFYNNPGTTFKKNGVGGSTPCANVVFVPLDCQHPKFKESLGKELPYILTHEISHAIRFRTPIAKMTLFESIISEGLADHFAMEITGRKKPPAWSTALTNKQKKQFLKKASKEWDLPTQHHYNWFYGSKTKKIPRWTAYTLGYDLVASYLLKNPRMKASKMISAEASIFIQ